MARALALAPSMPHAWIALGLVTASGFSGLGYQIIWTQQASLWLGHEVAAILAVVASFFAGLGLGALAAAPRIQRSERPHWWYGACEFLIASWAVALVVLMPVCTPILLRLIGPQPSATWHWLVAFGGTLLLLLPATAAMGATLPAMERVIARHARTGTAIAWVYAANTAGAVVGALATAFWLVPGFGLTRTTLVCAAFNVFAGLSALALIPAPEPPPLRAGRPGAVRSVTALAVTGLLGIGYEVLALRALSQVTENTVYTFALILAVYLVGTTAGAIAYPWLWPNAARAERTRLLMTAVGAACLLGIVALLGSDAIATRVLDLFGRGVASSLVAEALAAAAALLLPALAMGALFSHLSSDAAFEGVALGTALGINTLGASVAPLLFGVVLVPAVGLKAALLAIPAAYLALSLANGRPTLSFAIPAVVVSAMAAWMPRIVIVDVPAGGHLVEYIEGRSAAVSVVEDARGVATLRINNRAQEGSSATVVADGRQALLPLLLHPAPRRALFLGLGTGVTASVAARTGLRVDAVELLPEVIAASSHFVTTGSSSGLDDRLHVVAADARRFVRSSAERYDVIVSDNFHPARSGSAALYTVEHFSAVAERLNEAGLFCQWVPLHQLDVETLRSIAKSFVAVFPQSWVMLATNSLETPVVGFVGSKRTTRFAVHAAEDRLLAMRGVDARDFGLHDALSVLGSIVAGPAALERFSATAPLNTDDHPVVAYRAPTATYAPDSGPSARLLALLTELSVDPDEVIDAAGDPEWSRRLAAYWAARDRYLEAGQSVTPSADVRRMLAQVREPLLSVLRISPDFRPAYDPLLRMATVLSDIDPDAARALMSELERARTLPGLHRRELMAAPTR